MESFDQLIEQYDAINERIRRVDSHGAMALESGDYTPEFLADLNSRYNEIHVELGNESFERLREFKDRAVAATEQVVSAAKTTYRVTARLVESMRIAFDKTGAIALVRAKRDLDAKDGDVQSGTLVKNKSLAKRLHVYGQVPKDLRKAANTALTMSKYLRTTVVPQIDQVVIKAANEVLSTPPKSTEEFAESIESLMKITAGAKSLVDLISDDELLRQYPGGLSLCNKNLKEVKLPTHADVTDSASKSVLKKLETLNHRAIQLNRVPSRKRADPASPAIPILTRDQVDEVLEAAASLIVEGKALANVQKLFKGYPSSSIADGISSTIKAMHGKLEKDVGTKTYSDTGTPIEPEDRVRAQYLQLYYNASVMQHHQILPAFISILYDVANAYIALADESVKHYQ